MSRHVLQLLVFLPTTLALFGCGSQPANENAVEQRKESSGPVAKPFPPLQLAVPEPMPAQVDGMDLSNMEVAELLGRANQAMSKTDYSKAAAFQYWFVDKTKTGQYNLACFLAQIGRTDPAFYWLQLAASEEGVDTQHAMRDADLVSLRRDPRWEKVRRYLDECNRYFESAPFAHTVLILPEGYQKGKPIPAVVWLHGLGSRPEDFINGDCQEYADKLGVALIGVSGTKARGPRSFVWAEDVELDAKRLSNALAEVADRVTIKNGSVITFGFSQGAQMGLEIAVRNPELYAGSIVLSPGAESHLSDVKPSPLLAKRGFVVCCGAKEHPGNVQLTAQDADWLRRAKAQVIHKAYPGVAAHAFPSDFDERFPEWIKFVLKTRNESTSE